MGKKVINLDALKEREVVLGGETYKVRKPSVKEYMSDKFQGLEGKMKAAKNTMEQFTIFVGMIVEYSDIPEGVLMEQDGDTILTLAQMLVPSAI
ncbi:hypothetical protein [Pseudodesulfovibrio senegalensis]|uniref:Uncharacterized protein n=1 Tax=Pseudodesulfovibrio senegalensis TaxID=1721087 RepID=A0A6N6N6G7_9BACT|nr:hypothetical protein [Pseudodesulfovibrio senegalensis]KAB1443075.1 hypothetical protein F8A88_02080 [Pseudodesulfovibrio senegalensis]